MEELYFRCAVHSHVGKLAGDAASKPQLMWTFRGDTGFRRGPAASLRAPLDSGFTEAHVGQGSGEEMLNTCNHRVFELEGMDLIEVSRLKPINQMRKPRLEKVGQCSR